MANVDKAFGLRPYKGAGWPVQQVNKYNIVTTGYGTSIFQGDLTIFASGLINRAVIMLLLTELLPLRITIQPLQRHLEAEQ